MAQPKEGAELQETYNRLETFLNENQKPVSIGLGVLAIIVIAVLFVKLKYIPDLEVKAQNELFMAQSYFAKDSFNIALNGNLEATGFSDIIEEYRWTKAANLSRYYAGISSLNLGQYDDAIKYLKKFKSKDNILGSIKLSALGDAYSEKNDLSSALKYYKMGADRADNDFSGPILLMKAGLALEKEQKYAEAKKYYQKLKDKYPNSEEGRNADQYIARVTAAI